MRFTAEQYCADVLAGRVVAGRWVRLAAERHVRDLAEGHGRGLRFDSTAAKVAISFFSLLRHSKGEWAGQPVVLEPWQQFHLWLLYGWKRADGLRRFRTFYLEVARKNGKSTEAAGIGLQLMMADGEEGAEIYAAATKRDQAKITHEEARRMVSRSPQLSKMATVVVNNIHMAATHSKFEPLGRDADSLDGLNPHGVIVDEVHAHKSRELWDVLDTATGARRQPMMVGITTAGYDRHTLCWQLHEYTQKVLEGSVEDDSFLGLIYGLDEGDDWEDERVWVKANPNLGVSKKLDYMREQAARAKEMPTALNSFLRLHLNVWTRAAVRWMKPEKWDACGILPLPDLRGRPCYGGLDLSTTTDITAEVLVFPPMQEGEPTWFLPRFWIPEEAIEARSKRDRVPYEVWERAGLVVATPGAVLDYGYVKAQLAADMAGYDLRELAFDRWGSVQLVNELQDELGFVVDAGEAAKFGRPLLVQFGQGWASMNAPMKELERMVMAGTVGHGGNAVLAWMAGNVVASMDPAGNIKPDKAKSTEKIDGIVAGLMGLDRATRHGGRGRVSVYAGRGLRTL